MKTWCAFLILVAVLVGAALAEETPRARVVSVEEKLTGTWVGVSGHWGRENPPPETRTFTFLTNQQFKAVIDETAIVGTYRIAVSNEPFHIDFTFQFKGKKATTLTIFDFPKQDHLRIAEWDPNWRRKRFRPGITFKRKESSNQAMDSDKK